MVRISIPTLPTRLVPFVNPLSGLTVTAAAAKVASFLQQGRGRTLVITGAGISVDSGIRAYRGDDGRYTNPNFRPVYYSELIDPSPVGEDFRKRYWSRGYLGWDPVKASLPNPTHYSLAATQWLGLTKEIITQNVDGLHDKASPYSLAETQRRILHLHGTLHLVHCKNGHVVTRDEFQEVLTELNPTWRSFAQEALAPGAQLRTNPDGDVDLQGISYDAFKVPSCPHCSEIMKPNVVFFGESISEEVKDRAIASVASSSQLLILGTSLATFSAFRMVKQALAENKPVLILSTGPSRADGLEGVDKIEMEAGPVLRMALESLSKGLDSDPVLHRLKTSGVVKRPDGGEED